MKEEKMNGGYKGGKVYPLIAIPRGVLERGDGNDYSQLILDDILYVYSNDQGRRGEASRGRDRRSDREGKERSKRENGGMREWPKVGRG